MYIYTESLPALTFLKFAMQHEGNLQVTLIKDTDATDRSVTLTGAMTHSHVQEY